MVFAAKAQNLRSPGSFAYTLVTTYSRQAADAFSFNGNTAAAARVKTFSAGLYSTRRFGLKDLTSSAVSLLLPTPSGHFGLQVDYFGNTAYNEAAAGLAYARPLGAKAALGVRFNYFSLSAAGYSRSSAVTVDAGVLAQLTPQLQAGIQVCNPMRSSWQKAGTERLPSVYRAGLGYDVSHQLFVMAEAEKASDRFLGINAGLQYRPAEKLEARVGIQSASSAIYVGFGIQLKQLRCQVTASVHPYLGLSPGLLLLYSTAP